MARYLTRREGCSDHEPGTSDREPVPVGPGVFAERHFTVLEISQLWNLSEDTVRRLFRHEPGVLVLGEANTRRKRRYVTLRIPQSGLERVHRQYALGK